MFLITVAVNNTRTAKNFHDSHGVTSASHMYHLVHTSNFYSFSCLLTKYIHNIPVTDTCQGRHHNCLKYRFCRRNSIILQAVWRVIFTLLSSANMWFDLLTVTHETTNLNSAAICNCKWFIVSISCRTSLASEERPNRQHHLQFAATVDVPHPYVPLLTLNISL